MNQAGLQASKVTVLEKEIQLLREENRLLKAKLFGRSSQTKKALLADQQPELFDLDDQEADEQASDQEQEQETVTYTRRKPGGKRKPIPDHFPRREIVHDISDAEKMCACGAMRKKIGEETSEQIDLIPAKVEVLRHIRPKYACPCCEGLESTDASVRIAPAPKHILPKTLASPGLLAHLLVAKYADAVPFHRQEKQLARLGIKISRTTMSQWSAKLARRCKPLIKLIEQTIQASSYLQVDETPFRVHGESGRRNTSTSYMWVVRGGPPGQGPQTLRFHYSETRSASFAKALLSDYQGLVHSDDYVGYHFLEKAEGMTHLACWSHARRKFADTILANKKSGKKVSKAQRILSLIGKLYKHEKEADAKGLSGKDRVAYREEKSQPVLTQIRAELDQLQPKVTPDSKLGKAVNYMLRLWPKLNRCFEYGDARLDTNLVENAIRPFALGRKNWMHAGSPKGAEASAIWFSIIETAKANGWEPHAYLCFLFDRLPNTAEEALASLLPYNVQPIS